MGTKASWTPERRARQAELIRQVRPWERATGPKTTEGKAVSARNAYKGDVLHDLDARIATARVRMLAMFGRKRWPKGLL
jgi:hypothetical protein